MPLTKRHESTKAKLQSALNFHRQPELMEEIEVLWELDGTLLWWKADITSCHSAVNGHNGIRDALCYHPLRKYKSVEYEAIFHAIRPAKSDVKRLQYTSPPSSEFTPWKYPEEVVDVNSCTRSDSTTTQQVPATTVRKGLPLHRRSSPIPSSEPSTSTMPKKRFSAHTSDEMQLNTQSTTRPR